MKLTNFKLPIFAWNEGWGSTLNYKLTQIIQNVTYLLNQMSDGYLYPSTSVTATYSANVGDTVIFANGTFTVNLPSPSVCKNKRFTVKNTGAGTITIDSITGNVEGAATATCGAGVAKDFVSDGTDYWAI
jgi:hypothetical protein